MDSWISRRMLILMLETGFEWGIEGEIMQVMQV